VLFAGGKNDVRPAAKSRGLAHRGRAEENGVLQKFMKEHPEMDFSQAKIC
jgi:hypothetical protein